MPDLDLDAIRRAMEKASQGKWLAVTPRGACAAVRCVQPDGDSFYVYLNVNAEMTKETTDRWKADARFIAKAHEELPALLSEIERLRKIEAAAREYLDIHAEGAESCDLAETKFIYELRAALDAALGGGR